MAFGGFACYALAAPLNRYVGVVCSGRWLLQESQEIPNHVGSSTTGADAALMWTGRSFFYGGSFGRRNPATLRTASCGNRHTARRPTLPMGGRLLSDPGCLGCRQFLRGARRSHVGGSLFRES